MGTLGGGSEDHGDHLTHEAENSDEHEHESEDDSESSLNEISDEESEDDANKNESSSGKKKKKNGFATRISRFNAKIAEAKKEAEYWRNMATSSKSDDNEQEPNEDNYDDVKKYAIDLAKFHAKKTVSEMRKEEQDRVSEHRQNQLQETWEAQVEDILEEHPDYHEKLKSVENIQIHNSVLDEIRESDQGARITYYLASHPKLAKEISKLSPKDAIKRIHKIEHIIENSDSLDTRDHKPIQQSKAPHPTKPIKSTTGSSADKRVDDMTPDELDKWIKAGNTVKFGR